MMNRRTGFALLVLLAVAAPSMAQIPEAPGTSAVAPRDEQPGHVGGGLPPAVVPTESDASAPEIIDLMKRSRANAEGTVAPVKPKRPPIAPRKTPRAS